MILQPHTITRVERSSVYKLADASGREIAGFSTNSMTPAGGVFLFHPNRGWTKEQADAAIRAALKKGTP
jgi:hypothetical protein